MQLQERYDGYWSSVPVSAQSCSCDEWTPARGDIFAAQQMPWMSQIPSVMEVPAVALHSHRKWKIG